jgi:hypothetical protein
MKLYIGLSKDPRYPGIICEKPDGMTVKQVEERGDYVYRKIAEGKFERVFG